MALTSSTMPSLGRAAADFCLPDPSGRKFALADFSGSPGLLVIFLCNHCPFVKHIRTGLAAFAREYQDKGLAIVGINSNDATSYPEDAPDKMAEEAKAAGYVFPYLVDESQEVAKAFGAACTPDFFLYDRGRKLVYCGQFDGSRPDHGVPVTGRDLRAACDAVIAAGAVSEEQYPSIGCNIKWKAGNAPVNYPS